MQSGLKVLLGSLISAVLIAAQSAPAQEIKYQQNDPAFARLRMKEAPQPPNVMLKATKKTLIAKIETCIGVDGRSYNTKVSDSSGNTKFDEAVRIWASGVVWFAPQRCGVPVAICGYKFDLQAPGGSGSENREYTPDPVILPPCGSPAP